MRPYIKSYISSCPECCINKVTGGKKEAQLHVTEVVPIPFRRVHIDHLGPFMRSKRGNSYILVIVCAFTKYVVLKALRNTKTAPVLTTLRGYLTIYGCPMQIISDRGTAFTSKEFQNFIDKYDIQHIKVAVRTPRANGQAERAKWKRRFDAKHQTPRQYNEGDLVVVDYVTPPTGTSHKLHPSYKGPYLVTKVLPNDRYVVEDLPDIPKRRKRYAGIFTNDNMKPWCANGLIDDNCEDEDNVEETKEGIYDEIDEISLKEDDLSGKAELSNTAGNPTT